MYSLWLSGQNISACRTLVNNFAIHYFETTCADIFISYLKDTPKEIKLIMASPIFGKTNESLEFDLIIHK